MNVHSPLLIYSCCHYPHKPLRSFRKFPVERVKLKLKKIGDCGERSLTLVTALSPVIGHDMASKIVC
jgi:fumarate hydratase class II